jgi:hypothetical protein
MQIVELHLSHYNFCCPATGIQLFSREGPQISPALKAVWVAEIANEPDIYHPELEASWNAWVSAHEDDEDFSWDAAAFLATLDEPNWVAFTIHTGGLMAETATVVIDMDTDMDAI